MMIPDARAVARGLIWFGILALATAVLIPVRAESEQSHVALTLLRVVLGGSAGGGRALGLTLALAAFVLIDYFFQPPYDLLSVGKSQDWVVLLAFLSTALVATALLARAREEAEVARQRTAEVADLAEVRLRLVAEESHARELREANRAKDEVLATLSHDLRTPLTTIKLLAQRAAAAGDSTAPAIEEHADRLARLVTDVLDLSRISAGVVALEVEVNTAEDLVGAAIRTAEGVLGGRRVVAIADTAEPVLAGRFDFVQTLRIVGNLLDNALRHAPAGSVVEVRTSRDGDWMLIAVSDEGPGVPLAERDRIFEPFYGRSGAAPDSGRAGLGLSIARRLAELQRGEIEYQSPPGGGSVFTVRLPVAEWSESDLASD